MLNIFLFNITGTEMHSMAFIYPRCYHRLTGMNICYPASTNMTLWNVFSSNASAIVVTNYANSACSGAPISSYAENFGCDDNGFYTIAVSAKKGWGSATGFGVEVYTTTSACKQNSGTLTGNVFIASSPTGCYSSSNGTSDGVSCSGKKRIAVINARTANTMHSMLLACLLLCFLPHLFIRSLSLLC